MGLQEDKERVREASDIVDIISKHINLKPSGKNFKGLCPFHNEKTPSFFVDPDRQRYHCFGCQADGDVFEFLMKAEGMSFPEALENLAAHGNITLTKGQQPGQDDVQEKKRRQLFEVMNWASERFQIALSKPDVGNAAKRYCHNRHLTEEIITAFKIGYAPPGRNNLLKASARDHYSLELLEQAGMTLKKDDEEPYDRFRNRLMFPIQDVQGRIIAFGGRVIGQGEPKYLNSPETMIYHKGDHLFGLHLAKEFSRKKKRLVLVEGYMDVMACVAAGVPETVASLGTALTEKQAKLLKRYADQVIILYDSDSAGVKAAIRAFEIVNRAGLTVKALAYKDAKDPDEFIAKFGDEAFKESLEKDAVHFVDYMIDRAREQYDIGSIDGKVAIKNAVVSIIVQLQDRSEQYEYIQRLAGQLGQPAPIIEEEVNKAKAKAKLSYRKAVQPPAVPALVEPGTKAVVKPVEERLLISMMLRFPAQIELIKEMLDITVITDKDHRMLAAKIFDAKPADPDDEELWLPAFIKDNNFSEEESTYIKTLANEDRGEENPWPVIKDCIKKLVRARLREQEVELQCQIQEAASAGDMETLKQLEQHKFELATKIRQLGVFWK